MSHALVIHSLPSQVAIAALLPRPDCCRRRKPRWSTHVWL